jgi:hypothetical protein
MDMAAITQETLDLAKAGQVTDDATLFRKAGITTASGLVYYDLESPSKLIFPTPSPLRNMIPRVGGGGDTATRWKALLSINLSNMHAGVAAGKRGGVLDHTWTPFTAAYATIGLEESVDFEAEQAALGFDDARAKAALLQLKNVMRSEEYMILGGNSSLLLGTAVTPTCSFATSGGTVPDGNYYIQVIALGPDGYAMATISATGVIQTFVKTNADATTDTVNGNCGQVSAASSIIACTGGAGNKHVVSAYTTAVKGAVAYAWYIGTTGALKLAQITTINSVVISALPSGSNQDSASLVAADYSKQALVFDGLLTFASTTANNAYFAALATGTPGTGTTLTGDGLGGVQEFSTAFASFYDNYRMSPTHIWVNSAQILKIKALCMLNGSGAPYVIRTNEASGAMDLVAGIKGLVIINPITNTEVQVTVHPFLTRGTILFTTDELPYEVTDVPAPLRIKTQREYYNMMWPLRTRKWESGTYCTEVLQCYAPFTLGIIQNVA